MGSFDLQWIDAQRDRQLRRDELHESLTFCGKQSWASWNSALWKEGFMGTASVLIH